LGENSCFVNKRADKIGGAERFRNKVSRKPNLFRREGVSALERIVLKKRLLINGNIIAHLICQPKAHLKILQNEQGGLNCELKFETHTYIPYSSFDPIKTVFSDPTVKCCKDM
jgi:hypothetical protein